MILTSNNATSVLFVFMGMKTLAVTLREESISRVFENRVQSRVFESKMNEMTGGWRRLHSKKVHNLESLLNRKMGGGESRSAHGKKRNQYTVLVGQPEGNSLLERHRRR
jgi:hypothetical protein